MQHKSASQPDPEQESDQLSADRKSAPNAPENTTLPASSVTGSVVTPGDTISAPAEKTPLLCGVDTLDLGVQAVWNEADWQDLSSRLTAGKVAAGNTQGIRFHDETLILPKGRQGYAWHLQSPDLHLYVADRRLPHAETPNLYASPQCRLIWERGLTATADFVTRKIQELEEIVANAFDYTLARSLLSEPLERSLGGELSAAVVRFWEKLRRLDLELFTAPEVAKALGINEHTARDHLHLLHEEGVVELIEQNRGRVPSKWAMDREATLSATERSILPEWEKLVGLSEKAGNSPSPDINQVEIGS